MVDTSYFTGADGHGYDVGENMMAKKLRKLAKKLVKRPNVPRGTSVDVGRPTLLVDRFVDSPNPDANPEPVHATRHIGRFSGWGIGRFQRWTLAQCVAEPHTDADIGRLWEREHPLASAYKHVDGAEHYVKHNVRHEYNTGTHAKSAPPPTDADGRWNPTPQWADDGTPTYPDYPKRWMADDGTPNGRGPLPRAEK